jgi:hypothetical protein
LKGVQSSILVVLVSAAGRAARARVSAMATNLQSVKCPGCGARYAAQKLRCLACGDSNPRLPESTPRAIPVVYLLAGALCLALALTLAAYFLLS